MKLAVTLADAGDTATVTTAKLIKLTSGHGYQGKQTYWRWLDCFHEKVYKRNIRLWQFHCRVHNSDPITCSLKNNTLLMCLLGLTAVVFVWLVGAVEASIAAPHAVDALAVAALKLLSTTRAWCLFVAAVDTPLIWAICTVCVSVTSPQLWNTHRVVALERASCTRRLGASGLVAAIRTIGVLIADERGRDALAVCTAELVCRAVLQGWGEIRGEGWALTLKDKWHWYMIDEDIPQPCSSAPFSQSAFPSQRHLEDTHWTGPSLHLNSDGRHFFSSGHERSHR